MDENPQAHEEHIRRAGMPAAVTLLLVVALLVTLLPFALSGLWHLREYATFALFVPGIGLVLSCLWFLWTGPHGVRRGPCYAGCLFVLGGIWLDLFGTVVHSPDLEQEANLIARYLLDSGRSVGFVYAYGAAGQLCVAVAQCALWIALVKHLPIYLESSYADARSSFAGFLKAALGSGKLTWRQFFWSVRAGRGVSWYHSLCFLIPFGVLLGAAHRWYLGLDWFGLFRRVPGPLAMAILSAAFFSAYFVWLFWAYRRIRRASMGNQPQRTTHSA
jgi:hypothetical protein